MRNAFAEELTELGLKDPKLVLLSGDIGNRLFDKFRDNCPDRFYNCGVAEQNMMGLAAGLAMTGLRPVVYTIAPFLTLRCLEQIRTDVCYHHLGVIIVSVGGGLSYAGLGPSHHACEDIALLRVMPNMTVICPGDAVEVRLALKAALEQTGPIYIRLGKKGEPLVHQQLPSHFTLGRALVVKDGQDVCLMTTGTLLPEALKAAEILEKAGLSTEVVSFHTVKPLDLAYLRKAFTKFRRLATIEEHYLAGGFGSAVAEWLVDHEDCPTRSFLRFGIKDQFFSQAGEQDYAREVLGLNGAQIASVLLERHCPGTYEKETL